MYTVGPSTLPNAGEGLFALIDIEANTKLGEYTGRLLTPEQYKRLPDNTYVFQVTLWKENRKMYIDGNDENNVLRKMNGAKTRRQHMRVNCFTYQYKSRIYFKTLRPVYKGEELICTYGDTYWIGRTDRADWTHTKN